MEIKFVSFSGEYPCLCLGTLTLLINGKKTTFGCLGERDYPDFWKSGGELCLNDNDDGKYYFTEDDWIADKTYLPDFLLPYAEELAEIMNKNIPRGHCGGCL